MPRVPPASGAFLSPELLHPTGLGLDMRDHPTFKNSILAAGPDRAFKASYDGWGCLDRVIAVVEYRDPDRQAEAALFNMCELVRYQ